MSRHEGVSCDACSKKNFRGRRYKCLICYDYDLCAACYESGAPTTNHSSDHPVQCILTRSDFDMYYGGESLTVEQAQSFTCPYCGKMGFTETTLQEHLTSEHTETASEVVCPVCASQPGGEPNLVTDDLSGHLTLEHRGGGPRDLISFLDEPGGVRHGARRTPHSSRGVGSNRPRRCNMHYSTSSGISSLSPAGREADPIVELLTQLSGVRRSAAGGASSSNAAGSGSSAAVGSTATQGSTPSQLQQLQIQLQLERQQVREHLRHHQAARQQLERLPRRQNQSATATSGANGAATVGASAAAAGAGAASAGGPGASSWTTVVVSNAASDAAATNLPQANPQFLLSRYIEPTLSESELEEAERERADHSLFVQELMLSTLTEAAAASVASIPAPTPAPAPAPVPSMPSAALRGSESHPSGPGRDLGPSGRESPNRESPNRESPNRESPNRESPNRESPNRESPNREAQSSHSATPVGSSPASASGGPAASAPASNPSTSCVPPKTTSSASSSPSTTSAMTSTSSAVIPKRSSTRVAQVTTSAGAASTATLTTSSPTPTAAPSATTMTTTNTTARPQAQAQAQAHHPAAAAAAAGVRGALATRVVTGTGTIREMVGAASFNSPGSTRRKPVRPATEPPPPH